MFKLSERDKEVEALMAQVKADKVCVFTEELSDFISTKRAESSVLEAEMLGRIRLPSRQIHFYKDYALLKLNNFKAIFIYLRGFG